MKIRHYCCLLVCLIYCSSIAAKTNFKDAYAALKAKDYDHAVILATNKLENATGDDIGECYYIIGYSYKQKNNTSEAIRYYLKARNHYQSPKKLARINANIGARLTSLDLPKQALFYYQDVIAHAGKDSKALYYAYYNQASTYKKLQQIDSASHSIIQAETYAKAAGDDIFLLTIYNLTGLIYFEAGDYPHAIEMFHKMIKLNDHMDDPDVKPRYVEHVRDAYHNLANVTLEQGDSTMAIRYYQQAIALADSNYDRFESWKDIGEIYLMQQKTSEAETALLQALKLVDDTDLMTNAEDIKIYRFLAEVVEGELGRLYSTHGYDLLDQFRIRQDEVIEMHRKELGVTAINNHFFAVNQDTRLSTLEKLLYGIGALILILAIGFAVRFIRRKRLKHTINNDVKELIDIINH